jgi:serine/threonine-protein kinase
MLRPGARLGDRYRLDARIGAGGMGEVWRAVDEVLGRVVAVKAMLPAVAGDPDFGRRFLAEATAMAPGSTTWRWRPFTTTATAAASRSW